MGGTGKSDLEQLEGIVAQFDAATVRAAVSRLGLAPALPLALPPGLQRLADRGGLPRLVLQQQAALLALVTLQRSAVPLMAAPVAAAAAAAGGSGLRRAATEVGLWILEWALGKTLDTGITAAAGASAEAGKSWRDDGGNEVVLDGGGENWFSDSIAPTIRAVRYEYQGCCEQLTRGLKLVMKITVSDDGGDWMENDTGVRTIGVTAVRDVPGTAPAAGEPAPPSHAEAKEVGSRELTANEADDTDDASKEFSVDLCVPCGYVVGGKLTLLIKVADWNRNARLRKETVDIDAEKLRECCGG